MTKRHWIGAVGVLLLVMGIALSIAVEREASPTTEVLFEGSGPRALIVYHPSWLDRFQEELTEAFGSGLNRQDWSVDRITAGSPLPDLTPYALIAVGTNTYYWRPDYPTWNFLKATNLMRKPVVGLVSGAGSTDRAVRLLTDAIAQAEGIPVRVEAFWLWRPNDEAQSNRPNRELALEAAEQLGRSMAISLVAQRTVIASPVATQVSFDNSTGPAVFFPVR